MSSWSKISNSGLRKTKRSGYDAFPSSLEGRGLEVGLTSLLGARAGFEQREAVAEMNSV